MSGANFVSKLLDGVAVEWTVLGDERFLEVANAERRPVKASLRISGEVPYYGANNIQDYVDGYTHDGEYVLIAEDGSSSLESYSVQYASGKFWANNHVHVVRGKQGLNTKFLYHYLRVVDFIPYLPNKDRAKLTKGEMVKIHVPIPCPGNPKKSLEIQAEIVRILDSFTELTSELTAKLTAELADRKKQYSYYLEQLLSFEGGEVEWKTLPEMSLDFGRGKSKHRPRNDERLYGGNIPFIQTGDIRGAARIITSYDQTYSELGLKQSKLWPKGALCITIAANIAETSILGFDACFPDSVIGFVPDPSKTSSAYVEFVLQATKAKLAEKGKERSSAQSNINLGTFEQLKLPFPSLVEQARIVAILDKFDAMINSISEGLPREIELRQKQYEYYRGLLLSFPEPEEEVA
ncbi:restriction endonuclease subunit S [Pseudomonas sp. SAICEU22]|uniref:Restriction endonuclease subunit S n=1 Tax=Pseudomonas agronomica TaxID=2979328 RepID=A0ABT3FEK1_9PSED|nr:restriction endonuclease subunit S [Pseudomonas agronomica]MCW1247491.1 restriction endonuclease subunit S [Pseudomonas agronomica]